MGVIYTTEVFDSWFDGLRDERGKSAIKVRLRRAEDGNFGDCEPVGEGVSEMRIHYGPGYRVYFKRTGMEIVILLAGGDKSTQAKDIKKALKLAREP
ncbi:MAG: type II toxin-antitoxin system RelE/ParE family toxin [Sulfuritalea sp.]|nr:type II toxin-antitoxin system RelE/ParE family toxin [Sulfuritalea sp.]